MKNILLTILTILITVIMVIVMKSGINIGSLHILGFQGIAEENQKLLDAIEQSKQKNNEYTAKLQTINSDSEKLATAKKEYFDLVQVSTTSEIQEAMQIKSYRVEYLWSRVGNHATKEGVKVKMEIASSSMGDSEYKDLKFTVNGNYLAITNFIYDLENDESLDFTIDGFDMKSDVASFTVKDVKIIQEEKSSMTSNQDSVDNSNNANNTNNTNTVSETEKQKTEQRTNAIVNAFSPNN
jgi:hypothetical protein